MKEKQFEPAENNQVSPSPGLASVDTHNPDETTSKETHNQEFSEVKGQESNKEKNKASQSE